MVVIMVLLVGGLVVTLFWMLLDGGQRLREHFANNPNNGRIYIENGEDVFPVKAKRGNPDKRGEIYLYKWGGAKLFVIVPKSYPVLYIFGRRSIWIRDGDLVAVPLRSETKVREEQPNFALLAALVRSQIVVDLVLALTSKGLPKWIWLVLLGAVALGAFMFFQQCGGGEAAPPVGPPVDPDTGKPFTMLLRMLGV